MTKIKENITDKQFKLLMATLKGDESIRAARKERLLKTFTVLYYLGIRVNETTQFTNKTITELLKKRKTVIRSHKQNSEKYIYLTDEGYKAFIKIFTDFQNEDDFVFVSERGKNKSSVMNPISVIRDVNTYLKYVFGADTRITSHSFRQTLISNLATAGVNTKIIQNLIGHKSINTTYRYIKTTEIDIMKSLETVR